MERRLRKAVASWLAAERGADGDRAERRLRNVFLRLRRPAPPTGFVGAISNRLGLPVTGLARRPGFRAAALLVLTLTALAVQVVPGILAELWAGFGPGKLIELVAGGLVVVSSRVAATLAIWETVGATWRLVAPDLAQPAVLWLVGLCTLVSAGALRLLHELLVSERSSLYVESS